MNLLDTLNETYPSYRILMSLIVLLIYFILRRVSSRSVFKRALLHSFDDARSGVIKQVVSITIKIVLLVILGIIWGVSLEGISIYVASFLTVVGVGFFATWSIISNITASIILFFFFPFKNGSLIKIVDGDNSVKGTVLALSLFSIKIELEDGNEIYYPNNLAIQKGIIELKK